MDTTVDEQRLEKVKVFFNKKGIYIKNFPSIISFQTKKNENKKKNIKKSFVYMYTLYT